MVAMAVLILSTPWSAHFRSCITNMLFQDHDQHMEGLLNATEMSNAPVDQRCRVSECNGLVAFKSC